MMVFVNEVYKNGTCPREYAEGFIKMISCIIPHVGEEVWQLLGHDTVLSLETWPAYEEEKTVESSIEIGVQVNGKIKSTVKLPMDCDQETAVAAALADEKVQNAVAGKNIVKTIVVKNKIINLVVK